MLPLTLIVPHMDANTVCTVLHTFGDVTSHTGPDGAWSARVTWPGGLLRECALPVVACDAHGAQGILDEIRGDVAQWNGAPGAAIHRLQQATGVLQFADTLFAPTGGDARVTLVMALARALHGVISAPGFLFDPHGRVLLDFDGDGHDDAQWPDGWSQVESPEETAARL